MTSSSKRDQLSRLINTRAQIKDELSYYSMFSRTSHGSAADRRKLPRLRAGSSQSSFNLGSRDRDISSIVDSVLNTPADQMIVPFAAAKPAPKGVIRLPIFRLPAASAMPVLPSNQTPEPRSGSPSTRQRTAVVPFIAFEDSRTMVKALLHFLHHLQPHEKRLLTDFLHLQGHDLEDIELFLRRKLNDNTLPATPVAAAALPGSRATHSVGLFSDLVQCEDQSIFMTAQRCGHNLRPAASVPRRGDALRDLSAEMDWVKMGFPPALRDFLVSEHLVEARQQAKQASSTQSVTLQTASTSRHILNPYEAAGRKARRAQKAEGRAVRLRPLPSPAMSASTSHLPSPSQPEALTEALVSSLSSVQHHALLVKKTLEAAQSVVSVQDSKARHLLNMIAAERLFHALSLLPRVDLRRGWIAWRLHLHQQIREQRLRAVLRQLVLRNVVMGLHQIIQRLLRHRIATWKTFTLTETQRLRRQRILQATVTIQSAMRTCLAKKCVALLRQRKKYEKLYDATITLQRIMRGKRIRWRFLALCEERRRQDAILLVQRVFRGYRGRRHAAWVKFKRNRSGAAIRIQTMLRCAFARRKVKQLRKQRREGLAAVRIQALVRGVLARSAVASQLIERARSHYATKIQARVRGMITRRHRHRKMREIAIYKQARYDAARRIQAAYRGYRSRVLYRLMMFQWTQERNRAHRASTQITRIVRGYLSRKEMRRLKRQRREQWIAQARAWQECWDDDQSSYYYQHRETGVCHWEPTREGYTKYDGKLVLASGEIITDPAQVLGGGGSSLDGEAGDGLDFGDGKGGGGGQMSSLSRSLGHVLCIECSERVAIRRCVECGDNFCTKCYTALHLLGARRHHTYEPLGPRDCDECNLVLAERYCHACDECFCDGCWRSLHSHGKRVYHPYSEVSLEGRIDSRVYTMDGERLEEGGAAGAAAGGAVDVGMYTQAAADVAQARTLAQKIQGTVDAYSQLVVPSYGQGQGGEVAVYGGEGGGEEAAGADWSSTEGAVVSAGEDGWAVYYDDQGYAYYYNSYTGVSQYESPYE